MSDYLADTYQDAYKIGERALKRGEGLQVDIDAGVTTLWGPDLERFMDELAPGEPFGIVAVVPMPEAPEDEPECAWTITRDHLEDADQTGSKWTSGPSNISERQSAMLTAGAPLVDGYERHVFRMYDDDGILYYTGRAVFPAEAQAFSDEPLVAPLYQFGAPDAGATLITWQGHPDWECC